jgi:hypothetical protein
LGRRPELKSNEFFVVTAIVIEIISILVEIAREIRGTLIGILSLHSCDFDPSRIIIVVSSAVFDHHHHHSYTGDEYSA